MSRQPTTARGRGYGMTAYCFYCGIRRPLHRDDRCCQACRARLPDPLTNDAPHRGVFLTDDYLRLLALRAWLGAPILDGVPPGERGGLAARQGEGKGVAT